MIGKVVSHYKILEKLGEGGMGVVYKAEDTRVQRTVALKFLPHGLESHEPERARLLQEARAASALNHPNVCTIYDIGEADGQQFIVMEYVDGVTLREKIARGKLPTGTAVGYAIQIGEALEEAHGKGIVWTKNFPEGYTEIMVRDLENGSERQLHTGNPEWQVRGGSPAALLMRQSLLAAATSSGTLLFDLSH